MTDHQLKNSLSTTRANNLEASSSESTEGLEAVQLQRFLRNPSQSPHMMRAVQQKIGNQALQRLMRQTDPVAATPSEKARPQSIQRVIPIQRQAGSGVMQRNPLTSLKNKFKKWVNKKATEATFGSDASRRADVSRPGYKVAEEESHAFNDVVRVDIPSGPEQTLIGWHYTAKAPDKGAYAGKTILFLSGSAGTAENYSQNLAKHYAVEGANVLAVNYRGFGRSTTSDAKGQNRKMGHNELKDTMLYEDSRAMFDWLGRNGVTPDNVIVHGYSLGGAMAAKLVASLAEEDIRVGGLVLHSAIDSARRVAVRGQGRLGRYLGNMGADNLGSDFDTRALLEELSKNAEMLDLPISVISGGKDAGDHLDDNETGLSAHLAKLGFTNVGTARRADKSHEPDHLENIRVRDVLKQQLGNKPAPKVDTPAEDGVKEIG